MANTTIPAPGATACGPARPPADERWLAVLRERRGRHAGVRVPTAPVLSSRMRRDLAGSLATFQLGESGDGRHLRAVAAAAGSEAYAEAVALFVEEEREHARLLAEVLRALGAPLRHRHWADAAFVALRRASGLRTEVLVLLLAELTAVHYYAALRDGVGDAGLAAIFGRICDDEVAHVGFHAETLPAHLASWPPLGRILVRGAWNLALRATSALVALAHRRALLACGVTPGAFVRRCRPAFAEADRRLFAPAGPGLG